MKQGLDLLAFIVDKSGSMGHLVNDTVEGYNSCIKKQQEEPREGLLVTTLFDNDVHVSEVTNLKNAKKMKAGSYNYRDWNTKDYKPTTSDEFINYIAGGGTALLEAIGVTINKIGKYLSDLHEDQRPENILINIMTDGEENSSSPEFSFEKVKEMVTHQIEKYNWKFIFMGANIDSFTVGASIGVGSAYTMNYAASSKGTRGAYATSALSMSSLRSMTPDAVASFNIADMAAVANADIADVDDTN